MKAISLWQPWASAITIGEKTIETRHWSTKYRGPLAIHAAKRFAPEEREFAAHMRARGYALPDPLPLGAIVATCLLTRIEPTEMLRDKVDSGEKCWGNYSDGRFGWILQDVRPLAAPVPCVGRQSLWTLDPAIADAVNANARREPLW